MLGIVSTAGRWSSLEGAVRQPLLVRRDPGRPRVEAPDAAGRPGGHGHEPERHPSSV